MAEYTNVNDVRGCSTRGEKFEVRVIKSLKKLGVWADGASKEDNIKRHIDLYAHLRFGISNWQAKSQTTDKDMTDEQRETLYSFEWLLHDDTALPKDWELPVRFSQLLPLLSVNGERLPCKPGWGVMGQADKIIFEKDKGWELYPFEEVRKVAEQKVVFKYAPKKLAYTNYHLYQRYGEYRNRQGNWFNGFSAIMYLHRSDIAHLIEKTIIPDKD